MPTIAAPNVTAPAASARPEGPAARPERTPERTARPFIEVLGERRPPAGPPAGPRPGQPSTAGPPPPSVAAPVRALVDRALATEGRIDAVLEAAAKGKSFTPGELLALQSTVFRYSQTVEVISRVTDRVVGAIKQTLSTPA